MLRQPTNQELEKVRKPLLIYCKRRLQEADAEDVAQETLVRLANKSGDWETKDSVAALAFGIAKNVLKEHHRRHRRLGERLSIRESSPADRAGAGVEVKNTKALQQQPRRLGVDHEIGEARRFLHAYCITNEAGDIERASVDALLEQLSRREATTEAEPNTSHSDAHAKALLLRLFARVGGQGLATSRRPAPMLQSRPPMPVAPKTAPLETAMRAFEWRLWASS